MSLLVAKQPAENAGCVVAKFIPGMRDIRPVALEGLQGFPRRVRLTTPGEFSQALKQRSGVRNQRFALHVVEALVIGSMTVTKTEPPQNGNQKTWRLGLVIPKRYEASSVRRNAIKRVWRESFRRQRVILDEQPARDLVVRLLAPMGLDASGKKSSGGKSLVALKQQCHVDAELLLRQMLTRLQAK